MNTCFGMVSGCLAILGGALMLFLPPHEISLFGGFFLMLLGSIGVMIDQFIMGRGRNISTDPEDIKRNHEEVAKILGITMEELNKRLRSDGSERGTIEKKQDKPAKDKDAQ